MSTRNLTWLIALGGSLVLSLSGCEVLAPRTKSPTAEVERTESDVERYIDAMAELAGADPARQAEIFAAIERRYVIAPTTVNSLNYASALGLTDHSRSDPARGAQILRTLLASPEKLTPGERNFATVMLDYLEARLLLTEENRRLLATVDESTRAQVNSERRAVAQAEEITRLRKALEEAQQKLDAITDIERTIIERNVTPPANREPAPQSETPPPGR